MSEAVIKLSHLEKSFGENRRIFVFDGDLRLSSVNDLCELFGNEGRTADETAVYVYLGEKFCCVCIVHGTAVLDGQRFCCSIVVETCNNVTDDAANLVSLVGGSGFTGTDSPNGFISD